MVAGPGDAAREREVVTASGRHGLRRGAVLRGVRSAANRALWFARVQCEAIQRPVQGGALRTAPFSIMALGLRMICTGAVAEPEAPRVRFVVVCLHDSP